MEARRTSLAGEGFVALGVIFILAALTLYILFYSISSGDLQREWLLQGGTMLVVILAELGAVTIILEERLRNHFQTQYEQLREIIEIERREGRRYTIREKQMIFTYDPKNRVLKHTETNMLAFEKPEKKRDLNYPVYYDIKREITTLTIHQGCPRVKAYLIEENNKHEVDLRDLQINGNMLTAFVNPNIRTENPTLQIERCYKIDELDRYFTRMIQDPVHHTTIIFDRNTATHLMNIDPDAGEDEVKQEVLRRIKIKDHELRDAGTLFRPEVKVSKDYIRVVLNPTGDRPRFFIMDRIQILMESEKDETLGTPQGEGGPRETGEDG